MKNTNTNGNRVEKLVAIYQTDNITFAGQLGYVDVSASDRALVGYRNKHGNHMDWFPNAQLCEVDENGRRA